MATQNIYDDAGFFAGYCRLARSVEGLAGAPEWPALQALLPDLRGASVLDLGCGFGWFCRWARREGAADVLGVDVSENMLARARADTADPAIRYVRADLEDFEPPGMQFHLVYSSLALHYLENLAALIGRVARLLVPGGNLVFSVEHPIFTAPTNPGWSEAAAGHRSWPVDAYLDEGPRRTNWLVTGVVKQHRTIATYLNLLIGCGLVLRHVAEWGPSAEQIAVHPEWADERRRPPFLLVAARR
ncbi:MAG TPA: class I SAM-dependent methyltransferase [Stellaceae bacterium]|nr:class I SAM-dependent methyltransferase [Stellaceae bacterium]